MERGSSQAGLTPSHERQGDSATEERDDPLAADNPTAELNGPTSGRCRIELSCAAEYSSRAVADQGFAFEGVVIEIRVDGLT